MKRSTIITFLFIYLMFCTSLSTWAQSLSPEGYWKTIDDKTGEEKSIVKIWKEKGVLSGKIVKLFWRPERVCDQCSGDKHNKPMLGMTILEGLQKDDDEWSDGEILDPKTGKIYSCYIEVIDKGEKLKVRGYIGISLIGRTQYWLRTEFAEEPKVQEE